MCGIWGFVGVEQEVSIPRAWKGLCCLTDRGPDDWGVYSSRTGKVVDEESLPEAETDVFLGNRRLSILDLSAAGNQPMSTRDDSVWIVYNGEVYNYQQLRRELRDCGYDFQSETDTEVVLKAYQEYGRDCVERFRGMFAFAIWDTDSEELFAARDRFGIKPFYYDASGECLSFASELTSLLEADVTAPELDPTSVEGFLALGSVPSPRSILRDVRSLPSGSTMVYDATTGHHDVDRYWTPTFDGSVDPTPQEVRERLLESVKHRLRSDVPVGAFLSGGLDSSAIVALMREARPEDAAEPITTVSIGFADQRYSETEYAAVVAEELGTAHTSRTVTADDLRDALPDIVASMDQPTIDGVNTYFASQLASDTDLRVALSGLGADELLGGYHTFTWVPRLYRVSQISSALPDPLRERIAGLADAVARIAPLPYLSELADLVRSDASFGAAYLATRGLFPSSQRQAVLGAGTSDEPLPEEIERSVGEYLETTELRDTVSAAELSWYMHNQLLRDTDSMSMTHSLEVRVPFLDSEFVECITRTDHIKKVSQSSDKPLLKRAMADSLPDQVIDREKSGFIFPFEKWLDGELAGIVDTALNKEMTAETPLEHDVVSEIRESFEAGETHWSRLWALVVLSLWIDQHLPDKVAD